MAIHLGQVLFGLGAVIALGNLLLSLGLPRWIAWARRKPLSGGTSGIPIVGSLLVVTGVWLAPGIGWWAAGAALLLDTGGMVWTAIILVYEGTRRR